MIFKEDKCKNVKMTQSQGQVQGHVQGRWNFYLHSVYVSLFSILSFNFILMVVLIVTQFTFDQVLAYQTSNLVINEWNAHARRTSRTYRPLPILLHFLIVYNIVYLPSKFGTILLSS